MKRFKAGRAIYPLPARTRSRIWSAVTILAPGLFGTVMVRFPGSRPRIPAASPRDANAFSPLEEALGRKSNAVLPDRTENRDHTENTESGSGSKPPDQVVCLADWQKYPAPASFRTICCLCRKFSAIDDLQQSMTPGHSECEHNCRSWPWEQPPVPQFRQSSAATISPHPEPRVFHRTG
jgi:hypothetical protein